MRKYVFAAFIILFSCGNIRGQWEWKNPMPTGNLLDDVQYISSSTAIAVGSGTILRTTNGGGNWTFYNGPGMGKIDMVNQTTGYGLGWGTVLKTEDGGFTWHRQKTRIYEGLSSVSFANTNTGIAVGGAVITTSDGGNTWERRIAGTIL